MNYRMGIGIMCLVAISAIIAGCGRANNKSGRDMLLAREEVIQRAKAGSLTADNEGKVVLPTELKAASNGGEIYLSAASPETGLAIVFILSQSPENTMAYLYCDTRIPRTLKTLQIGPSQWNIQKISDEHWALVSKL